MLDLKDWKIAMPFSRDKSGSSLPSGLAARVVRFEAEYLDAPDGPVPFGGRQEQLASLDAWLASPSAAPRLLVSGPAGRGKSALLVRWLHTLKDRPSAWRIIFVPVSIRFATNRPEIYLRLLTAQLASAAGETLKAPASDPARFYLDQAQALARQLAENGPPTLAVIDGLDEAVNDPALNDPSSGDSPFAALTSSASSKTLRIVVSARWLAGDRGRDGWLTRLGWPQPDESHASCIELPVLTGEKVAAVLESMGEPSDELGADAALVHRLTELTGGEPLALRLYAEDLRRNAREGAAGGLAILDGLRPGFALYFQRWLDLQEQSWRESRETLDRTAAEMALAVLSFAKGPLEGGDLLALMAHIIPKAQPSAAQLPASHDAAIRPLRRFVVGDGSRAAPYALCHPKLGQYLAEERYAQKADAICAAFVQWGQEHVRQLNAGELRPDEASPYALQFLIRHFEETGAPADAFLPLAEEGWRRAWEGFEDGLHGFASDVRAVWRALRRDGDLASLGKQWRCVLTLASIKSAGAGLPWTLVVACVEKGLLSVQQGQYFAELMVNEIESVKTLAGIALAKADDPALCAELAFDALRRAAAVEQQATSHDVFRILIDDLASSPRLPQELKAPFLDALAEETSRLIASHRLNLLVKRALLLPEDKRRQAFAEAFETCGVLADWTLTREAAWLAAPYMDGPTLAKAAAIARSARDDDALLSLAPHLPPKERRLVLRKVFRIVRRIDYYWYGRTYTFVLRAKKLMNAARLMSKKDSIIAFKRALAELDRAKDGSGWDMPSPVLVEIIPHLPGRLLPLALRIARETKHASFRAGALIRLAPRLKKKERAEVLASIIQMGESDVQMKKAILETAATPRGSEDYGPHIRLLRRALALPPACPARQDGGAGHEKRPYLERRLYASQYFCQGSGVSAGRRAFGGSRRDVGGGG